MVCFNSGFVRSRSGICFLPQHEYIYDIVWLDLPNYWHQTYFFCAVGLKPVSAVWQMKAITVLSAAWNDCSFYDCVHFLLIRTEPQCLWKCNFLKVVVSDPGWHDPHKGSQDESKGSRDNYWGRKAKCKTLHKMCVFRTFL